MEEDKQHCKAGVLHLEERYRTAVNRTALQGRRPTLYKGVLPSTKDMLPFKKCILLFEQGIAQFKCIPPYADSIAVLTETQMLLRTAPRHFAFGILCAARIANGIPSF